MEWHFGYNCTYYLPILGKCRILIDNYRNREDLVEQKWLNAKELLIYLGLPNNELIQQMASGEIKVKLPKDSKIMFGVLVAWQYDNCPLANAGGQCFYFESHNGNTISCLMELRGLEDEHPNSKSIPTEEEVKAFESTVIQSTSGQLKYA